MSASGISFQNSSLQAHLSVISEEEKSAASAAPQSPVSESKAPVTMPSATGDRPLKSRRIRLLNEDHSLWVDNIPDVGMDKYMVTKGTPMGTSGVGPCFAIICIGYAFRKALRISSNPLRSTRRVYTQIVEKSPVYGLCHTSSLESFPKVLSLLKDEMVAQQKADRKTIRTYVVGGQNPSEEQPEGTLSEEAEILSLAKREKIKGALFNLTNGDDDLDGIDVLLKDGKVFVSKKPMFEPYVDGVGTSL